MKIELFALCNYVSNHDGRLTIIDTFETLTADKFPWRAYFGVAVKIDMSDESVPHERLMMHICPDGREEEVLFQATTTLDPAKSQGKLALAANLKGLVFDEPGLYHFKLTLDGNLIFDYPFKVIQRQA